MTVVTETKRKKVVKAITPGMEVSLAAMQILSKRYNLPLVDVRDILVGAGHNCVPLPVPAKPEKNLFGMSEDQKAIVARCINVLTETLKNNDMREVGDDSDFVVIRRSDLNRLNARLSNLRKNLRGLL